MADTELPRAFTDVGVRTRQGQAPKEIDFDWLRGECERLERVLRLQYAEPGTLPTGAESLPPDMERGLAENPLGDSTTTAMRRWAYLKHLYLRRSERLVEAAHETGAAEAARELLRRDPVTVRLSTGREVELTGRSYSATYAIAQHWARLRILDEEVKDVAGRYERVQARIDSTRIFSRARGRYTRLLERLEKLHRKLYLEMMAQRQALYAHAFTADGRPAESLEQAPEWWMEVTWVDDAILLDGLAQAGPGRWRKVWSAIEADRQSRPAKEEKPAKPWQSGWGSLFAVIEREAKLEPASCYDRDLYQLMAWMHQLPTYEREERDA